MGVNIDCDGNITVYSGDDDSVSVYYSDSRVVNTYDWFFTVKPTRSETTDDTDALLQIDPDDCSFYDSNTKVLIPINQHAHRIPAGKYKYDIQYKLASGNINTLISGKFIVTDDVTKRTE